VIYFFTGVKIFTSASLEYDKSHNYIFEMVTMVTLRC